MASQQKNLSAILSIIAGVVVIAWPAILTWVIGLYLIIAGILHLTGK